MNCIEAAQLHTLATLHAGGPGSGRHPEFEKAQKVLHKSGYYTPRGMNEITPLEENEKGFQHKSGSQAVLNSRTGGWEHTNEEGTKVKYGKDADSLKKYISKVHGK
jgi:hypothetical protein